MENTRVAILGIIISDMDSVEPVNALLHESSEYSGVAEPPNPMK